MNTKYRVLYLLMALVLFGCLPLGGLAASQSVSDPNAVTVVGSPSAIVKIDGWVRDTKVRLPYGVNYPGGIKKEIFYLHSESPVDWYPSASKPVMEKGLPYHRVFHAYDLELSSHTSALFEELNDSRGKHCVTVTGRIRTNEYNAAPGSGPLALAIVVSKVSPCGLEIIDK